MRAVVSEPSPVAAIPRNSTGMVEPLPVVRAASGHAGGRPGGRCGRLRTAAAGGEDGRGRVTGRRLRSERER
ncbi:hypothetical protein Kpho02_14330 [Kitasatospora phosalacinea]|uniref:Uncharacterized protein n=1 Tax=Kitasatospora phosalacinea TaxID=2065 RepID=A0A9W6Q3C8_9ACTN|nr:hypothetical protein Kpho02_14330 [Kitasatospora phosalacinea]